MSSKKDSFFGGLILGSIFGGILTALFTPISGGEARNKIKEKLDDLKKSDIEEIKIKSHDVINKTIASIEEGIERIALAIEEAKKASEQKRNELEEKQNES